MLKDDHYFFNTEFAEVIILFLPGAGCTDTKAVYDTIFAKYEALLFSRRIGVVVYKPLQPNGFYMHDKIRLRELLLDLNEQVDEDVLVVFCGVSMGAFGALRLYTEFSKKIQKRVCGLYLVSPLINLVHGYTAALESEDPAVRAAANGLIEAIPLQDLSDYHILNFLACLKHETLFAVLGGQDELVGNNTDRAEFIQALMDANYTAYLEYDANAGHSNWNIEGLLVFARTQRDSITEMFRRFW